MPAKLELEELKNYIFGDVTILHLSKRTACAGKVRALAEYAVRNLHEPFRANFEPPAARNPFEIQI